MICPYCNTKLVTFRYEGYYDTLYGWKCACDELPKLADSKAITGAFAYGNCWEDEGELV
jgi:hypothetical protein